MMKAALLFLPVLFMFGSLSAQQRILMEEHSGANCPQCPIGSYIMDSMVVKYPGIIPVALHTYSTKDSMYIPVFDTLRPAYATGAPMATIDRIYWGAGPVAAIAYPTWETRIQSRLQNMPHVLDINISMISWAAATRTFSAKVDVQMLSSMSPGDYRISMYVVEDSVTGTGPGYDQLNAYHSAPGSPFFGMGNPVVGYVHRHVVRSVLPDPWGQAGIISATPAASETFSYTFNGSIPASHAAGRISLVAFVYRYTANHLADTVYNAVQKKLTESSTSVETITPGNSLAAYPNPSADNVRFTVPDVWAQQVLYIYNQSGQLVHKRDFRGTTEINKADVGGRGLFYYRLINGSGLPQNGKLLFTD